jgi:hypothetical protein
MLVRADGSVIAAGGDSQSNTAFVARLLGAAGGESPGVLGITPQSGIPTAEGGGEAVVTVRRTGGADGSVSVAYDTAAESARAGEDFSHVSGMLSWGDGDLADQQIRVPIIADTSTERPERFRVTLRDSQGGAGLGTTGATVDIVADGGPFGQLTLAEPLLRHVTEFAPVPVEVSVFREYYSSGVVSVTLTPIAGTATADADFVASPITLTWADGERGRKVARIPILDDADPEQQEEFTVQLSNPAGGAVLGSRSTMRVAIFQNDQPASVPGSDGGGGAFDFLSLFLLGLLRTMRRFISAVGVTVTPPARGARAPRTS